MAAWGRRQKACDRRCPPFRPKLARGTDLEMQPLGALEGRPCHEIDVRSCRLNGICEGNVEDIPIFSPLDEFVKAKEGILYDYQWVDVGHVRAPLRQYIYDGPRWYDKATTKFMLETGVCKWGHIQLGFQATAHRGAAELASTLRKLRVL